MSKDKAAVIFDVGGVLITPPQRAIADYEKEIDLPRGVIGTSLVAGSPDNAFCRMERGELTLSQFFPAFEREFHMRTTRKGIDVPCGFSAMEMFRRMTDSYQPCREMIEAVRKIKKSGLKTCVVTNNWIDDVFSKFSNVELFPDEMFDVVIESSKVGLRKPDPEIYRLACSHLGVHPHQTVFLDDLGVNLKAARELGITTIKVTDPRLALKELGSLLNLTFTELPSKL